MIVRIDGGPALALLRELVDLATQFPERGLHLSDLLKEVSFNRDLFVASSADKGSIRLEPSDRLIRNAAAFRAGDFKLFPVKKSHDESSAGCLATPTVGEGGAAVMAGPSGSVA